MPKPKNWEKITMTDISSAALPPTGEKSQEETAQSEVKIDPFNIEDIDSGQAMQNMLLQYVARIRQLKSGLSSSHKENDQVINEYIMQNLELQNLNKNLENQVKKRTRELEDAKAKLESSNETLHQTNVLLEEQKRQLQEVGEMKEALMQMIVHDLKNPLTAILGTLALFNKNSYGLNADVYRLLVNSYGHSNQLLAMIEEILLLARMQTKEFRLKPESCDLVTLAGNCLALMRETPAAKNANLVFRSQEQKLCLQLDVHIIERVINNLLNNALKYAPKTSEITLGISRQTETAAVSVTNWGKPIPSKYHASIFELFTRVDKDTRQFSGTGLGLAFTKLAVMAHQGSIKVVSPVPPKNIGACFCFTLPLQSAVS
ncbi:hypothetical protein JW933_05160 [candidate division FCPU426 bacterium]|nr:hypothetical protein [candidate division FCPU426 bacterium]